jgi:hypothetical protein
MIGRKIRLSLASLGVSLLALMAISPLALAATQPTANGPGNGLRVSPVRSDPTIKPGEIQTVNLTVTNVTSATASFQAIINDFTANPNESGEPSILLNPNDFAPSHSLKRYIDPIPEFTLRGGQQIVIPVNIRIPKDAAGGGYFGVVRFAPAGANAKDKTVSLAGSVGSLLLVKVPGDIKEHLSIASFDVRRKDSASSFFTSSKDLDAVVRFQNEGNVQEAPFGKILLKNRSGKILATYEINSTDPPGNILPDSIRKFPTPLGDKIGSFGQYKLEGNFGYGNGGQLLSASTTFFIIPKAYIYGFVALVLLIVFLVLGVPRLIKAYNQRILRRAGRR